MTTELAFHILLRGCAAFGILTVLWMLVMMLEAEDWVSIFRTFVIVSILGLAVTGVEYLFRRGK
jgi:hypothetical protein